MQITRPVTQVFLLHLINSFITPIIPKSLPNSTTYCPPIPGTTKDFSSARRSQRYLVDKSLFIKELLRTTHATIVITRPRRWGKSLNMDMVATFLRIEIDEQCNILPEDKRINPPLFKGGNVSVAPGVFRVLQPLKITEDKEFTTLMGKYPVIQLTLLSVRGSTYSTFIENFQIAISSLYDQHECEIRAYVNFDNGTYYSKRSAVLKHYIDSAPDAITERDLVYSIQRLSNILKEYYRQPVVVLLDEYDTPLTQAFYNLGGNTNEYLRFEELYNDFLLNSFKENPYCGKALLTGIYDLSLSSIGSGRSDALHYSVFNDRFSEYYGFTESEVKLFHENVPNGLDFNEIKLWYKGYTYGEKVLYNPYSIMRCLEENTIDTYWLSTGTDRLAGFELDMKEYHYFGMLEIFPNVTTKTLKRDLKVQINFHNAQDTETMYTLLVFLGYLNPTLNVNWPIVPSSKLTIPNTEVRCLMKSELINWLYNKQGSKVDHSKHKPDFKNLLELNMAKFEKDLANFIKLGISSLSRKSKHGSELYYHRYLLALIIFQPKSHYVEDEETVGGGKTDILCIPKFGIHDTGVIWELKKADKLEELSQSASIALQQIYDEHYDTKLKSMDHVQTIIKIGMSFNSDQIGFNYTIEKREVNDFVVYKRKLDSEDIVLEEY